MTEQSLEKFKAKLSEMIREVVNAFPFDIRKRKKEAQKRAVQLEGFDKFAKDLALLYVLRMCDNRQHTTNTQSKQQAMNYDPKPKVKPFSSPGIQRYAKAEKEVWMGLNGLRLDNCNRDQLIELAEQQEALGNGYFANAILCRKLAKFVNGDEVVSEKISYNKYQQLLKSARNEALRKAA